MSFRLADGETTQLGDAGLRRIYDALWNLSNEPGAATTAALLLHEWRQPLVTRKRIDLTQRQTDVFRKAMGRALSD